MNALESRSITLGSDCEGEKRKALVIGGGTKTRQPPRRCGTSEEYGVATATGDRYDGGFRAQRRRHRLVWTKTGKRTLKCTPDPEFGKLTFSQVRRAQTLVELQCSP